MATAQTSADYGISQDNDGNTIEALPKPSSVSHDDTNYDTSSHEPGRGNTVASLRPPFPIAEDEVD